MVGVQVLPRGGPYTNYTLIKEDGFEALHFTYQIHIHAATLHLTWRELIEIMENILDFSMWDGDIQGLWFLRNHLLVIYENFILNSLIQISSLIVMAYD